MKRLFIRPELCTGCKTCELACAVAHSASQNLLGAMTESPRRTPASTSKPHPSLPSRSQATHDPPPPRSRAVHRRLHPPGHAPRPARRSDQCGRETRVHRLRDVDPDLPLCMIGRVAVPDDLAPAGYRVMAVKCDLCPTGRYPPV